MVKMIIDASDLLLGRLATVVAKKALLGETIDIVNSEKVVISGNKDAVFGKFKQRTKRTVPLMGPYIHRSPDRLLRRAIRGMLPYKQKKGSDAFGRVMCWKGVPKPFEGHEFVSIKEAHIDKLPNLKFVTLGEVSKYLGGKIEN